MITYADITAETLREYPVVVNCSPVGMYPHVDECPTLPYEAMNEDNLLYDLVYNPEETLFLKKGREQGATVKNGLEMLILQAIASEEFWNE
jgi:shikimate dehydrogenase